MFGSIYGVLNVSGMGLVHIGVEPVNDGVFAGFCGFLFVQVSGRNWLETQFWTSSG
jgi:hypothetical protein